jgi:hypothetical protein
MRIDAVVHMVDRDGWKVNDLLFLAADGQRIDPPLSLTTAVRGAGGPGRGPAPPAQASRSWYDNPVNRKAAVVGTLALIKSGGLKFGWGALLLVGGAIWAAVRRGGGTPRPAA